MSLGQSRGPCVAQEAELQNNKESFPVSVRRSRRRELSRALTRALALLRCIHPLHRSCPAMWADLYIALVLRCLFLTWNFLRTFSTTQNQEIARNGNTVSLSAVGGETKETAYCSTELNDVYRQERTEAKLAWQNQRVSQPTDVQAQDSLELGYIDRPELQVLLRYGCDKEKLIRLVQRRLKDGRDVLSDTLGLLHEFCN